MVCASNAIKTRSQNGFEILQFLAQKSTERQDGPLTQWENCEYFSACWKLSKGQTWDEADARDHGVHPATAGSPMRAPPTAPKLGDTQGESWPSTWAFISSTWLKILG